MQTARRIIVGTAGHIDHGKSLLIQSLTGTNPDRLKEEQDRGITIDLGFASLVLDDGTLVGFVDVPGHERFVRNMLAGIGGIDLVLLVVASDESIKPQTREHFEICRLLRIPRGVVALTKADLVDPEILDLVRMEVRDYLAGTFMEDAPVVAVSAKTGAGLGDLRQAITRSAAEVPLRPPGTVFRLPVDRSFTIRGFGTVVTGTLITGKVSVGEEVEILPGGRRARVRGLEVFGASRREATAGQRTAVNLQGLEATEVVRGDLLASPGAFQPTRLIDAKVEILEGQPALGNQARVRFHCLSAEVMGRVRLAEEGRVEPGKQGLVQIRLSAPVAVVAGDRFILRRPSPPATIGGGTLLDNHPQKLRAAEVVEFRRRAENLAGDDLLMRLREWIRSAGKAGIDLEGLRARTGLELATLEASLQPALARGEVLKVAGDAPRFVDGTLFCCVLEEVAATLEAFHRQNPLQLGISKEEIRSRFFRREPGDVFRHFLEEASRRARLRVERDLVALAGHRVALAGKDAGASEKIEEAYRKAGLNPPDLDEVAGTVDLPRKKLEEIFYLLTKQGTLVRVKEGRVFHRVAIETLKNRLWEYRKTSPTIDIAAFKDLSGTSRKNAIPLLEHLDAIRVTRRDGNRRRILPPSST